MKIIRPIVLDSAHLVSSNVAESDWPVWNIAEVCALGDTRMYISGNAHWIVESLQNANSGHTPTGLTTDLYWLKTGNTNRWKMYDQAVNSQTSNLNSIDTVVIADGRADSVVLLNINAASVQVTMADAIDGMVYNQSYSLVSDSGINDWYAYFFEPIVRLQDFSLTDMPPYANAQIEVVLTDAGNTALCGACIIGLSKELGATQYGMSLGIDDYSVKEQDAFGNYSILERPFRRTSDMSLWVENSFIDQLHIMLSALRATPTVYIGSDLYKSSIVYGFYKNFSTSIQYVDNSICTLTLEGLT